MTQWATDGTETAELLKLLVLTAGPGGVRRLKFAIALALATQFNLKSVPEVSVSSVSRLCHLCLKVFLRIDLGERFHEQRKVKC